MPSKSYNLSKSDGHTHRATLDKLGNGRSSTNDGHSHKIIGWKVYAADGHSHRVIR